MKILIISSFDINGGAARAAYRLHKSLLLQGEESKMLVQIKSSDDYTVIGPTSNYQKLMAKIRPVLDSFPAKIYKNRSKTPFSTGWVGIKNIVKQIEKMNPDIVHIHWAYRGMIRFKDIAKINVPVIWTLHDMWPFTGGCHYDEECGAYINNCGSCKVLHSTGKNDLSRKIWKKKKKALNKKSDITILAVSKWLQACAKKSNLFKNNLVVNLPNPINTNTYKPIDKHCARELWNLPQNKKLVLFGAIAATTDPRKGYKEFREAINDLAIEDVEFVVFGSSAPRETNKYGLKTHFLGQLSDDISLNTMYNAVDVMVVPSLQENLSNAILESLSCGTPVVAFNIGGNSDMIEHKINGYLAKPFDTSDLAKGIEWILGSQDYKDLCKSARKKIINEFDNNIVAQKYIELYSDILR